MLEEALEHLVKGIVDNPDDLGKVIGRGGRTAKALRTVMAGVGGRGLRVDVVDTDGH